MPIETQTRDLLHRAGDEIDVPPPPLDRLLGSAARRRRRVVTAVAGVAAASVVIAVVLVNAHEQAPGPADRTPPASDPLVVSPGMRLVGAGDIAVEVPDDWGTSNSDCPITSDAVAFDPLPSGQRCLAVTYTPHSVLHVDTLRGAVSTPGGDWLEDDAGPIEGLPGSGAYRVAAVSVTCAGTPEHDCPALHRGAVVVPASDTVMWVESSDPAVVEAVLGSARAIPDGYVAIPGDLTDETASELDDLGLEVTRVEKSTRPLTYDVDPPAGSVVAVGSEVTVSVPNGEGVSEPEVTITSAFGTCGPTDRPAVDVVIESAVRKDVFVLLLARDSDIVGKLPTRLRPDTPNHVVVPQYQPAPGGYVDVEVLDRASDSLARLNHVSLELPAGVFCG